MCVQGYKVKRVEGRGYIVLAFFGQGFRVALQDMQLIMDVCPLRVDAIFMRDVQDDDFPRFSAHHRQQQQPSASNHQQQGAGAAGGGECTRVLGGCATAARGVMCISVLDVNQPVQITESEVVRVKKRSRGLLFSSVFGSGSK